MQTTETTFAITIKHEGDDWYLARINSSPSKGWPVYQWSSLEDDALTNFKTANEADEIAAKCGGTVITREACPKCHGLLSQHPAISREDNETKICTRCGIKESLEAFERSKQ